MTDSSTFDELLLAEDELVDDYLRGSLSAHEQQRFDTYFLSTQERRQKLSFAGTLKRYIASTPRAESPSSLWSWFSFLSFWREQNPGLAWSLAAALLLIVIGGSWSALKILQLKKQVEQANIQQSLPPQRVETLQTQLNETQARNQELAAALQREQNQLSQLEQELTKLKPGESPVPPPSTTGHLQPALMSFVLSPGLVRDLEGSKTKRVTLPSDTNLVQFRLDVAGEAYSKYRAVLQKVEGQELLTQIWPVWQPERRRRSSTDPACFTSGTRGLRPATQRDQSRR